MLNRTINVQLITPESLIVNQASISASLPGREGKFTILAGHEKTIFSISPGMLEIEGTDKTIVQYEIGSGIVRTDGSECFILTSYTKAL